ncbi:helix-turn-helix transcriptional regulator [Parapedobacter sp. ISTM3]|uniref:helix-turn-helix domain-containing protein n=1 Tax=Parapedobacter sp. ISTM3 TaxID=2800130 RepID=UPI0019054648|nr:helix-turn-helix transcriptional regulator [Parapedobacter sp. ISTM3]MBK1442578.1 helix-turn-helix transcriptional regulator [Parapedobacter sp. ISTM3]
MDNTSLQISSNVVELRDALGLSQKDFSILANIASSTLINIESGNKSFKISTLSGILAFTNIKLEELSKASFVPPKNLRAKLTEKYKNEPSIYVILSKEPSIPYAIKYKLLKTDFLDQPKETRQIAKFFRDNYGWRYKGNSIHSTMRRLTHLIDIKPHPNKGRTNLYSKKK